MRYVRICRYILLVGSNVTLSVGLDLHMTFVDLKENIPYHRLILKATCLEKYVFVSVQTVVMCAIFH